MIFPQNAHTSLSSMLTVSGDKWIWQRKMVIGNIYSIILEKNIHNVCAYFINIFILIENLNDLVAQKC